MQVARSQRTIIRVILAGLVLAWGRMLACLPTKETSPGAFSKDPRETCSSESPSNTRLITRYEFVLTNDRFIEMEIALIKELQAMFEKS